MIYFDNAASTMALPEVAQTMCQLMQTQFANPASISKIGLEADREIRIAAEILGRGINGNPEEIFFTSGGTEGDNWAIFGTAEGYHREGKHLITTQIEHPAVKNPMKKLEEQGFEVTYLPVNEKGEVDPQTLSDAIRPDTILVSIILVNNETGTVQDMEALGKIVKEKNAKTLFHVDGVQAFGKYPIDVKRMKIDLLTMSGHKIHGPKGVGMLYKKQGLKVKPMILGGGQQGGQRGGTENPPAVAALGIAAKTAFSDLTQCIGQVMEVKRTLAEGILHDIPNTHINGQDLETASPYVLNITFQGLRSEVLLHALESEGIFVSAGSACDSKKKVGSAVLTAMGLPFAEIEGALRFSFSRFSTVAEAKECLEILKEKVAFLRKYQR